MPETPEKEMSLKDFTAMMFVSGKPRPYSSISERVSSPSSPGTSPE
ncbi:hypothetical protein [Streptomyces niveus]